MQRPNFYNYSLCHVCKQDKNVKRCSKCKYLAYCSIEHQKFDWPVHKYICKAISETRIIIKPFVGYSFEEWTKYRISLSVKWSECLKRQLFPYEHQMWMFPPVCIVCFSEQIMVTCSNCLSVSYCCEHCNRCDSHTKHCEQLKLCMNIDKFLFFNEEYPKVIISQVKDDCTFPKNSFEFLDLFVENTDWLQSDEEKVLKYEILAPSAIVLYSLNICQMVENKLFYKPQLTVHFVGASNVEATFDWQTVSETIFHYVKNVNLLFCHLIGPNCNSTLLQYPDYSTYCANCTDSQKKLKVHVHSKFYHEVQNTIQKPDLVVLFNSGLHEFEDQNESDTWKESLFYLVHMEDVPVILTAYTKCEILKDGERLKQLPNNRHFFIEAVRNPFRNLRPLRDWYSKDEPVFYSNNYISIIK